MRHGTDKTISFIHDAKSSLYGRCVREGDDGHAVDYIPFPYTVPLTATGARLVSVAGAPEGRGSIKINAELRVGWPSSNPMSSGEASLRFLGVEGQVESTTIWISATTTGATPSCWVYAGLESEDGLDNYRAPSFIEIHAEIEPERFSEMERMILSGRPIQIVLTLKMASGVYAPWSPDPEIRDLKVLTMDGPHSQEPQPGCDPFPVAGSVGEFSINTSTPVNIME